MSLEECLKDWKPNLSTTGQFAWESKEIVVPDVETLTWKEFVELVDKESISEEEISELEALKGDSLLLRLLDIFTEEL